jgi:uncharacterized membrane protein YedE/YeeE
MSVIKVIQALIFGIGFGYFAQKSGLCFANGLGEIFTGRGKRIYKLILVIFIISSLGFVFSKYIDNNLGLKVVGEIRGYGFYNIIGGMFFGAGIFLCGGCIIGSLRQLGEGNLNFVIVILSFIPGMALTVYILNPLLANGYNTEKILVSDLIDVNPVYIVVFINIFAIYGLYRLIRK